MDDLRASLGAMLRRTCRGVAISVSVLLSWIAGYASECYSPFPMLTDTIRQLRHYKLEAAALERLINQELAKELATLPKLYGFASVEEFARAVQKATGKPQHNQPRQRKRRQATQRTILAVIADAVKAGQSDIIINNAAASGVTILGAWTASTGSPAFWGTNYLHDMNADKGTKSVTFTPTLPVSGE